MEHRLYLVLDDSFAQFLIQWYVILLTVFAVIYTLCIPIIQNLWHVSSFDKSCSNFEYSQHSVSIGMPNISHISNIRFARWHTENRSMKPNTECLKCGGEA